MVQAELIVANCQKKKEEEKQNVLAVSSVALQAPKKTCCLTETASAYPDLIHVIWLHFPQCRPVETFSIMFTNDFISQFKAFFTSVNTPLIVLNEFNKFFLTVGFTRDDDGFIHEGLVKIHFIQLQA